MRKVPDWCVATLAAVLLFSASCKRDRPDGQEAQVVTIGGVLPLTGDAGTFGQNAARGIELAVSEANAQKLIPGKTIRFVAEDSRGNAADAVSATRKLIDVTHANMLIGDVTSAGTQAIIPIVTQARVPLVSPAASAPALSGASPYFARVWPSDVYEAQVIGDHAKGQGYRKIAVVYANTDYGVAMVDQFRKVMGPAVVALNVGVDRETMDYRPTIERIRRAGADALFLVLYPEDARRMLDQLRERRLSLPLLATATFEDPLVAAASNASRVVFASPVPPSDSAGARRQFLANYKTATKADAGVLSAEGYDAAMILIRAYAQHGNDSTAAIMQAVRSLRNYPGVSGTMTLDANGDVQKPYQLRTVRDGKFVWLNEASAAPQP